MIGVWEKFHNEEPRNFHSSPDRIIMMKLWSTVLVEHVARKGSEECI
jgi:hypothetical protein